MSSNLAHLPEHAEVAITLIGRVQGTFFGAHSVADIQMLVDKKHFDVNMIIVWIYKCPKLAVVFHF